MTEYLQKNWSPKDVVKAEDVNRWEGGIAVVDINVANLKSEVAVVNGELPTLNDKIAAAVNELSTARGVFGTLSEKLASIQGGGGTGTTDPGLQTQVNALEQELVTARGTFASLSEKLTNVEISASNDELLQGKVSSLENEMSTARGVFASLSDKLLNIQNSASLDPEVSRQLDDNTAELAAARGTFTTLADKIASVSGGGADPALQATVDATAGEMATARGAYLSLADKLVSLQPDPAIKTKLDATAAELVAARGTSASLSEKLASLEAGSGTDPLLDGKINALELHAQKSIATDEVHGLRTRSGKLEFFNGSKWTKVLTDGYKVGNLSGFTAVSGASSVKMTWTDPADVVVKDINGNDVVIAKWASTKIVRKELSYPTDAYDGTLVTESTVKNQYSVTPFDDITVQNNRTYYYMAFPTTSLGVETVDAANRVLGEPSTGPLPGPQILIGGNNISGYYGRVPQSEFITGADLALALGLSAGSVNYAAWDWLKFSLDGKPVYTSSKSIRYSLSWEMLNAANIVFGNRTIKILGNNYKVRLWRGAENNPAQLSSTPDNDARGSEWNRLILPITDSAPFSAAHAMGLTEDWGVDLSYADLGSGTGNGATTWCQETSDADPAARVVRGSTLTYGILGVASTLTQSTRGWRPVLELI